MEQLIEIFAAGYTLEKPDYSKSFEEIASLAETTPPNEPLTLEELREMDGQPVFLVFMQPIEYGWEDQWALVDSENETVFNSAYKFDFSNCVGFAYRRPPEGEEDI